MNFKKRHPEDSDPGLSARQCSYQRWIKERRDLIQTAFWEGEERLQALLNDCLVAVYLKDLEGRYLAFNRWSEIMFHLTREEVLGKTDHDIFPEEVAGTLRAKDLEALEAKAPLRLEQAFPHEDGQYLCEISVFPLHDSSGNLRASCGIAECTCLGQTEEALKDSEERFRTLADAAFEGIAINENGKILEVNRAYADMFGYEVSELRGMSVLELHPPEARDEVWRKISSGFSEPYESKGLKKDGTTFDVEIRGRTISYDDRFVRITAIQDVTERKRAEEALKESEERYRAVVEQSVEGIFLFDPETKQVLESNTAFQRMLGHVSKELREMTIYDFLAHGQEEIDAGIRRDLRERQRFVGEQKYCRKDGILLNVEVSTAVIPYHGREVLCTVARDVSERKALEDRLWYRAFHDSLTGLPNRALFLDRLRHAFGRSGRLQEPIAVLFVDLDDFKLVNDSLGHDAGNILLLQVGERLRVCVRPGDTVARLFGDEFAVLLEAPTSIEDTRRVAGRIGDRLRAPFRIEGEEVYVNSSVGIALNETAGDQPEEVLRRADLAMYTVKSHGKGRYEIYEEAMETRSAGRLRLESELRRAVEREEFEIYYQPIVELGSGRTYSVEALLRWRHPEQGLLSPRSSSSWQRRPGLCCPWTAGSSRTPAGRLASGASNIPGARP